MRFLSTAESQSWVATKGSVGAGERTVTFAFPESSTRMLWLARSIGAALPVNRERLLLIREWGIWPSSEDWNLFRRLRSSYGEDRSLELTPGHVFTSGEQEDLDSFLHMCVMSGWDAELRTDWEIAGAAIRLSHDEWVEVASTDASLLDSIAAELRTGGLRQRQ